MNTPWTTSRGTPTNHWDGCVRPHRTLQKYSATCGLYKISNLPSAFPLDVHGARADTKKVRRLRPPVDCGPGLLYLCRAALGVAGVESESLWWAAPAFGWWVSFDCRVR